MTNAKRFSRPTAMPSPMSLGTMTSGSKWGWGAEIGEARRYAKTMFGASEGH